MVNVEKRNRKQNILIVILCLAVLSLMVVSYYNHRESKDKQSFLEREKEELEKQLSAIISQQETLIGENETYKNILAENNQRISGLLDSLRTRESSYEQIIKYRSQLQIVKAENKRLNKVADSLIRVNETLKVEVDQQSAYTKALEEKNQELTKRIENESVLRISNILTKTYSVRIGDKVEETDEAPRVGRFQFTFSVLPNSLVDEGDKNVYLQVIDPNGKVMGLDKLIQKGSEQLVFSKPKVIFYTDDTQVVTFNLKVSGLQPGTYSVNIFHDFRMIGSSQFPLK